MARPRNDWKDPYGKVPTEVLTGQLRDAVHRLYILDTAKRIPLKDNAEATRIRALSQDERAALRDELQSKINNMRASMRLRSLTG